MIDKNKVDSYIDDLIDEIHERDRKISDLEDKMDKIKVFIESDLDYKETVFVISGLFDERDYAKEYHDMQNEPDKPSKSEIDEDDLPF